MSSVVGIAFRRRWSGRAAVALGAVAVAVGSGAAAGAQPPPCPSPGVLSNNTCQFVFGVGNGAPQTVSIPAGVKMTVSAAGAQGASGEWLNGYPFGVGGAGGTEQGTFTVAAAKTLTVIVGDSGTQSFSGGGAYPPVRTMGAGGGGSFVFDGGTPLVIAGGGGGAGSCTSQSSCAGGQGGAGGDATGGTVGQDGLVDTQQGGHGGGGGTPSAGGGGGAAGDTVGHPGQAGYGPVNGPGDSHLSVPRDPYGSIGGRGGFWATDDYDVDNAGIGGGGGGGWTGGGGGGESWFGYSGGGGGGGSGYISPEATNAAGTVGTNLGAGGVVISYTASTDVTIAADGPVQEPASGSVAQTFTVTLPAAQSSSTTVGYTTADGTATAAANDYAPVSNGSVVVPAGQTSAQIQVAVDTGSGVADVGIETYQVQLASATNNLTISSTQGRATGEIDVPGIAGTVTDRNGSPLADASVVLAGTAASGQTVSRQVTSDSSGRYSLFVDPGSYTLTAAPPQAGSGELYPSQCPNGSPIPNGCELDLPAGASDTINLTQAAISITQVRFQQRNVASGASESVPSTGTIDGNMVDVIATLHNNTAVDAHTDVAFGNATDESATVATTRSNIDVPASTSVDVDDVLDTNGLAWDDSGGPDPQRQIKITLSDGTHDTATLTVRPKPVILVHGLWSNASVWDAYVGGGGFLAHVNVLWRGYAVGDGQAPGVMNTDPFQSPGNTIADNAAQEATYIQGVRAATDAAHVDIVAHSMGGLISRYYIQQLMPDPPVGDSRPVVAHLVMLGTPNEGSNCAYDALAVESLFGLTASVNQPLLQLTPAYLATFDQQITNRKGVAFSILAGNGFRRVGVCTNYGTGLSIGEPNDGVVTVPSAEWTITDRTVEPLVHTAMNSSPEAFTSWVMPHLILGPSRAGGGAYTGPLSASVQNTTRRTITIRPHAAARRPRHAGTQTLNKSALCLRPTPAPAVTTGAVDTVNARQRDAVAISVPANADTLTAVILADPAVTTSLIDPRGHDDQTVAAGSAAASALFRTLAVHSPLPGTWHLIATSDNASSTRPIAIAIQFAHSPIRLTVTATTIKRKPSQPARRTGLRLTARVAANGHPLNTAHVTARLLAPGNRPVVLRLNANQRHAGRYSAQTTLPTHTTALVLVQATTPNATTTSTLQLAPCPAPQS